MLTNSPDSCSCKFRLAFVVLSVALMAGCVPEVANTPTAEYVNRNLAITGDFYEEDRKTGKRRDLSIKKTGDEELSFSIDLPGEPAYKFQVYTIGELNLAFLPLYDKDDKNREKILCYAVVKLQVTKTQIVIEILEDKFFENNPAALPGTVVNKGEYTTDVAINSTPQQLVLFFKLHQDTTGMFDSETPILYNRIK